METKVTTSRTPLRKITAKRKPVVEVPLEPLTEAVPVKKTAVKRAAASAANAKPGKKPSKTLVLDPLAETVKATSTVKKRPVKKEGVAVLDAAAVKKTTTKKAVKTKKADLDVTAEIAATEPKVELSPVFKTLSEPVMPELQRENRARLQMQSPGKLYFYWSAKENPYHMLRAAFGSDTGSYTLVLKLTNLRRDTEEIQPAEAVGNWWFDVEPDGLYQAEIGFYATNRPYFRILHSNTVETPRRSPSPRVATDADWKVSAYKFAEVLDVAGFTQDAFDVAIAGDDHFAAENATHGAFTSLIGKSGHDLGGVALEDIRYAMIALASGVALADLRSRISPALFAILQENADKLASGKAMSALTEHFDIDETEFTEEHFGPAVFGASLVNFPRTLKTRTVSVRYSPHSSHSLL